MSQTYKFGRGTWANKEGSTLAYSDTNNAFKPLPFSFSRDSIATRVNKEGLIEVVGKDIPRIDYTDSAEGVLLLENSSTNLVTYSEAFDNSYWQKNGITINPNAISSPDGTTNAYKLVENTSNTIHTIYKSGLLSQNSAISIFAKAGENSKIALGNSSLSHFSVFDLSLGVVVINSFGSISNAKIENYGNGWYKCSCNFNHSGSNNSLSYSLVNDNNSTSYQGDGTSGVYIWGAMLEANSVASSYIPTSGSTVQRAAENANGSGNSEVFSDSSGVLFANWGASNSESASKILTIKNSSTTTNRVSLYYYADGICFDILNSSGTVSENASVQNAKNFNKVSLQYQSGNTELWVNGFKLISNTQTISLIGLNKIDFDYGTGQYPFYGKTKEIGYYDTALTDAELETLTSYRSLNELVTELNLNTL